MQEKSGAQAAYIDRKSLSKKDLSRLVTVLEELAIPLLSGSEIAAMGNLSWDRYCAVRRMAGEISHNTRCYVHGLEDGPGPLVRFCANETLLTETLRCDEPGFIRALDPLPVVHLSTQNGRILPDFITNGSEMQKIINDLNTLCVKIIRNNQITATEKDHLILAKVRFDPQKARELGILAGPLYQQLAAGQKISFHGNEITPEMVSSCHETKIHIPGLEKYL